MMNSKMFWSPTKQNFSSSFIADVNVHSLWYDEYNPLNDRREALVR